MQPIRLGIIGYGEVGGILCVGLADQVESVCAWDIKLAHANEAQPLRLRAERDGIPLARSLAELCTSSNFIISAVTASSTVAVAREAAPHLQPGTVVLDLNSAAPASKQSAAAAVQAAGGQYVEAAVMSSVPPHGIRVPMLLGGAQAASVADLLTAWGMQVRAVATAIGTASAIKMCRSVMIKGLEALVIESFATARSYGVEDEMLASLQQSFPGMDWPAHARYFFARVARHGRRRAEEMREVADTVRAAGFEPWLSAATAQKDDWMADRAAAGLFAGLDNDASWQMWADRLRADADTNAATQ